MCFDNLWGLIEEAGWTMEDAKVVCKQLNYGIEGMQYLAYYQIHINLLMKTQSPKLVHIMVNQTRPFT